MAGWLEAISWTIESKDSSNVVGSAADDDLDADADVDADADAVFDDADSDSDNVATRGAAPSR